MKTALSLAAVAAFLAAVTAARGDEAVVTYKSIAPDAALEVAKTAQSACRAHGYQVAVVVLDRFGEQLVLLRDQYAGLPAAQTANDKAYTALSFHADSGDFAKRLRGGQLDAGLAALPHVVPLAGGLVIEAGGALLGAVGVAGAPGGDKDEECAKAGLNAIRDKIDF